jgi:hypothetical protein
MQNISAQTNTIHGDNKPSKSRPAPQRQLTIRSADVEPVAFLLAQSTLSMSARYRPPLMISSRKGVTRPRLPWASLSTIIKKKASLTPSFRRDWAGRKLGPTVGQGWREKTRSSPTLRNSVGSTLQREETRSKVPKFHPSVCCRKESESVDVILPSFRGCASGRFSRNNQTGPLNSIGSLKQTSWKLLVMPSQQTPCLLEISSAEKPLRMT